MRKCRNCKKELPPVKLSDNWQRNGFCVLDCMAKYGLQKAKEQRIKKEKAAQKEAKAEVREYKLNDYKYQFQLTKKSAQKLANRIDESLGYGCISCGTQKNVQYCGGHFKTAGGHSELALDIRNINRQCNRYCNMGLSGNIEGNKTSKGYKVGILERYGQEYLDYLTKHHPPKNYTCDDLIAMRKEFNAEIRRLEQGLPTLKSWKDLP